MDTIEERIKSMPEFSIATDDWVEARRAYSVGKITLDQLLEAGKHTEALHGKILNLR